ncbi:hypothetical protein CNYM01_02704 [Colletotrichum nymphaeae SA-01]|uniref:Uncharacterized protein n=1 Tax=Colletotrichum nymphaeae SA-01 TaxID=1460502 RepID=A0A135RPD3_9PEZI|nr:hypothetical protein CNYM01_02704 [Colletotrichum nymphaeae SA-01]
MYSVLRPVQQPRSLTLPHDPWLTSDNQPMATRVLFSFPGNLPTDTVDSFQSTIPSIPKATDDQASTAPVPCQTCQAPTGQHRGTAYQPVAAWEHRLPGHEQVEKMYRAISIPQTFFTHFY